MFHWNFLYSEKISLEIQFCHFYKNLKNEVKKIVLKKLMEIITVDHPKYYPANNLISFSGAIRHAFSCAFPSILLNPFLLLLFFFFFLFFHLMFLLRFRIKQSRRADDAQWEMHGKGDPNRGMREKREGIEEGKIGKAKQ